MKIAPIRQPISRTEKVIQNIKRGFGFVGSALYALKYVVQDTFTREKPYYVEINGKLIDERELPNAIGRHDYWEGVTWDRICFSPEDEEILKNMPREERGDYRGQLIRQRKYTVIKQG